MNTQIHLTSITKANVHDFIFKRYIVSLIATQIALFCLLQLQFCVAFLHSSQLLFYDCGYPRWSVVFTLPNSIFFYYLFYDFYYKAYGKPGERNKKQLENGGPKRDNDKKEYVKHEYKVANGIKNGNNNDGKKVD